MNKWNWSGKFANEYNSREYKRNRVIIVERDCGMCFRCFHLHGIMRRDIQCDHYIPLHKSINHSLNNLWLLCNECHKDKSRRESYGQSGFSIPTDSDGWRIEGYVEPDWPKLIEAKNNRLNLI